MHCISLHQPWASAVALGAKRIETRSWRTDYRGPLAIHAAQRCVKGELVELFVHDHWRAALEPLGTKRLCAPALNFVYPWDILPFGAIVAVCQLAACLPVERFGRVIDEPYVAAGIGCWTERQMGNFGPGRYGWVLADIRALRNPVPYRGERGLFDAPDSLLTEVLA